MVIINYKKKIKVIKAHVESYFLKAFGYTYKGKRYQPIIFILSTGRCGSTSIKKVFNQHPKFIAFHEDISQLIELSTQLAEKPDREKEIYHRLDEIFSKRIWEGKKGQVIVHSDHRLWNLVPYLNNYFRNAYFIHLIRNPFDSVRSYLQRDWYLPLSSESKDNMFEKYRLQGDRLDDMKELVWNSLNQTEKCLWYWNYVNTFIYDSLNAINKNSWDVITLEGFIDHMNHKIKIKFKLNAQFYFKNEITNRSKKKLESNEVLNRIASTIKMHKDDLFLTYYPEVEYNDK